MTRLVVPHDRFSAIDYFLQCCEPGKEKGVKIDKLAYSRMKGDPYLKKVHSTEYEETWIGEEVTINGVYYPPLVFTLLKKTDAYIVTMIKDGDKEYAYSEEYTVEITYQ